ncbi:MAG: alpha/beta fold hydrolase [Dehalococcoidia bacterium]|nr:alpha/beta fold hydrolase [Dehalococcoidia bacterium]
MNRRDMRNYGPPGYQWELWHEGPVRDRQNIVLVHGYRLPLSTLPGRCDEQFGCLDRLLQDATGCNVWQFEYVGSPWGTYDSVSVYARRLDAALTRISEITGNSHCSMIGYSMGGLIARRYIAMSGKPKVDKLLTLATPHMGTLRFEPFSIPRTERFYPMAGIEIRPDSRLLWDLNTNVESSTVEQFAALGGYSWGNSDGTVEIGSTSLVKCADDGSVKEKYYFAGVPRSHLSINRIKSDSDEVFQMIMGFLTGGVCGISRVRCPENPGDYHVPFFLTFSVADAGPGKRPSPRVVVTATGRTYRGPRIWTQGARTESGAQIYTVQLRPDDNGEARIYYGPREFSTVQVQSGQSTVVVRPVGTGTARAATSTE